MTFIHKLALTVLETGFLVTDETDTDDPAFPIAGFGVGQLMNAFHYMHGAVEQEMTARAEELAKFAAERAGGNVVPGPGWKPPETAPAAPETAAATITRPVKTDRQIVDEVNDLARVLLGKQGVTGYRAPGIHRFYGEGQSPRVTRAWADAVEIYELITGSEVHDALQAVLEEEEAATAPAVPAEPVS
jgi:hypothetical protein